MIKKSTFSIIALLLFLCPTISFGFNDTDNQAEKIQRVRINFVSPLGNIRPLLLAFTPDDSATDGIDYGYDSRNNDYYPNDLNWIIEDQRFVIQGVGSFNDMKFYELGLYLDEIGETSIYLYDLENFETDIPVYIYDAKFGDFTSINDNPFKREIEPGSHLNRFYIAFSENNTTLSTPDVSIEEQVSVSYAPNKESITVTSNGSIPLNGLTIYSIDGKKLYDINKLNDYHLNIPTANLRSTPLIFSFKFNNYVTRKSYLIPN